MTAISLTKLNRYLGNKYEAYRDINTTYLLHSYSSKAITVDYLSHYIFAKPENPNILMVLRKDVIFEDIPPTREAFPVPDLFDKLEHFLKENGLPPTGLEINTLPDRDWILRILRNVDLEDKISLFGEKTTLEDMIMRQINPR